MIVCVCHRVSDRDIARAVQAGCEDFDALQFDLGVATACGKCHECAHQTFQLHAQAAAAGLDSSVACAAATPRRVIRLVPRAQARAQAADAGAALAV